MKLLKNYNQFNEGIRELMTPKSEEEILKSVEGLNYTKKLDKGVEYGIPWVVQQAIDEAKEQREIIVKTWHITHSLLYNHFDIVRILVDSNPRDLNNDMIAGNAYRTGNYDIVKYLVEHGLTANRVSLANFYQWMRSGKNSEIIKLLISVSPVMKAKLVNKAKLISRDLKTVNDFLK